MTIFEVPNLNETINLATSIFSKRFQTNPSICSYAPGRVNLIGEHTDYNDGFVLPMALPMVTVIVGEKTDTQECTIITICPSADDPKEIKFPVPGAENTILTPGKPMWANYVKGVIANFKGKLNGFNAVISTTVPVGGGLSSSAALEVASYYFLEALNREDSTVSHIEKALACQKAEHDFLNMPCGIMDQFISIMGEKDHVLFLDCRSLEYKLIELKDPEVTVLITNTNVKHKLSESQYPIRKKQCEMAAKIIGKSSLRDVTLVDLQNNREILGEEVYSRALHVVSEIKRTADAVEALQHEDYRKFGALMTESHNSLRDQYEVSCAELDTVVSAALEVEGVYGSRMTGGGFGGCTVTLLKTDAIIKTVENIMMKYKNPTFYTCRPGDGAKVIHLTEL
ncbi:Galactokinase like protein [Argiope bruennichi]|uniref:Galactokinase like protein n=1 Tax=Argiope bruennichi TaxID=94029 RepID=A0A8T0E8F4_ARGBR|nr:Galactokinase like protein [Argiope bruennichi]